MDPADKFVTPRPPPATPSVVGPLPPPPASAMAIPYERRPLASSCGNKRPVSPLPTPRHLLRHQRSVRSLSPSPSISTWSPRRLFARRASPSREVKLVDGQNEEENTFMPSSVASENDTYLHRPVLSSRLVSSSASSISSISRSRQGGLAPAPYYPSTASQGSRSRDISPESLRRFLVDDAPLESLSSDNISLTGRSVSSTLPAVAVHTDVIGQNSSFLLSETDDEDEDDFDVININKNNRGHDLDFIDDDEHNFATSTTSETAPMTILSPPPPASRNITPLMVPVEEKVDVVEVEEASPAEPELPLPKAPTRAPPAIPEPTLEVAAEAEAEIEAHLDGTVKIDLPQLNLELPPVLAPPSPMSLSPMSMSSMSGALSFQSHEDDSEPLDVDAGSSAALFLPPPEHPFRGGASESCKADPESQQHRQNHHHHLMDAALTGSTTTLVPGNGLIGAGTSSGLDDLVDELGWMATAIQG
ncbi:hypothetical protein Sste5346_001760 [Sporothrix stenoceras]|uniref:Uncharacterized protein n=1 Tax=Sporothrix stenoceras TaxID=5173 RepID=A0ABR3ZLQ7_9PEZI